MMHLTDAMIERVVARFRALADAHRIRLLLELKEGERSVGDLVTRCGISQASTSKHLGQLRACGLVTARRVGNQAFYSIRDRAIFTICNSMCRGIAAQSEAEWHALSPEPS